MQWQRRHVLGVERPGHGDGALGQRSADEDRRILEVVERGQNGANRSFCRKPASPSREMLGDRPSDDVGDVGDIVAPAHVSASSSAFEVATAPNTPPCMVTIFSAAW